MDQGEGRRNCRIFDWERESPRKGTKSTKGRDLRFTRDGVLQYWSIGVMGNEAAGIDYDYEDEVRGVEPPSLKL
jgi:hypothetical protein